MTLLHRLKQANLLGAVIATAVAFCLLVSLGTWQMSRKAWKEALLATMAERARAAPVTGAQWSSLACNPAAASIDQDPCDFRPVRLVANFRHGDERHIFISVPRQANGIGGPGYWVFTPAMIRDAPADLIYINRGFVPEAMKVPSARTGGQPEGDVEIAGVIRRAEVRMRFSNSNDSGRNIYYVRDPEELGA